MKGFEEAIKKYLDKRAGEDSLFAEAYKNTKKNIEGCCNYILNEVKKQAKNGKAAITDDEVFSLAVHYYDEADLKQCKPVNAQVVISGEYAPMQDTAPKSKVKDKPKQKIVRHDSDERQLSLF